MNKIPAVFISRVTGSRLFGYVQNGQNYVFLSRFGANEAIHSSREFWPATGNYIVQPLVRRD